MKLILTQDVPHLGSLGDEVQVKNGYARNFLLPKNMAIAPTNKNAREIAHRRKFLEKSRGKAIEAAQAESVKVAELELVVKAKAGPSGKLFGSVTNRDIQALLAEQGYTLDRRAIQLPGAIKTLGEFSVVVKLHTDVRLELKIRVEAAEGVSKEPGEGETTEEAAAEAVTAQAESEAGAEAPAEAAAPENGVLASTEAPADSEEQGAEPAAPKEETAGDREPAGG